MRKSILKQILNEGITIEDKGQLNEMNPNKLGLTWQPVVDAILFKADTETRQELKELVADKGLGYVEGEVLGDMSGFMGNGGQYVNAEDIGALSSATFVVYDNKVYSDINYYQIRSFVDDLIDHGSAKLHFKYELTPKEYNEIFSESTQLTEMSKSFSVDDHINPKIHIMSTRYLKNEKHVQVDSKFYEIDSNLLRKSGSLSDYPITELTEYANELLRLGEYNVGKYITMYVGAKRALENLELYEQVNDIISVEEFLVENVDLLSEIEEEYGYMLTPYEASFNYIKDKLGDQEVLSTMVAVLDVVLEDVNLPNRYVNELMKVFEGVPTESEEVNRLLTKVIPPAKYIDSSTYNNISEKASWSTEPAVYGFALFLNKSGYKDLAIELINTMDNLFED